MSKDKNTEQICCDELSFKEFTYTATTTIHSFAFLFEFITYITMMSEPLQLHFSFYLTVSGLSLCVKNEVTIVEVCQFTFPFSVAAHHFCSVLAHDHVA